MEHPLRVDEFVPAEAPPAAAGAESVAPAAKAAATALPPLPNLAASDVQFLTPSDPHYADFLPAANKLTQLAPALRAVCKTEHAVAVMVDWVRDNGLNFATRCGGHSYEGFSQSADVVIDVRGLKQITVDKASNVVTAGSGVSLYELYSALAAQGLAVQAGSCPTVGISGHLTGGGHGLLARSHGLTCDGLQQATLIDAQARTLHANATSEPDLYWACRGGGGGSFGIATEFKIGVFPLNNVLVFGVTWKLSQAHAAQLFAAWQSWAPNAPSDITSIMKVGPLGNGLVMLRCIGQSVGSEAALRSELKHLISLQTPSSALTVQSLSFLKAVLHFAGTLSYESVLMKAKSDYVLTPLAASGIAAMMAAVAPLPSGAIALLCDSYGGKIADIAPDATAFPRRAGTQFCIQYYASWSRAADTATHLAQVAKVYAAMRPYMPGASYVNYCDLDLADYATAYWGDNLARLVAVKQQYDPDNLFHHAQSVPLSVPAV
ncbi:FAD-binding oxidoreductase [Bradyrhizobium genosp. L]|uniref:FAD-binding oxidoreductase n=1 Tax=Bradyrhizobium genosp. L TaxID=83637 RepID=UPI0018A272ED|nr:FAD-binding oxidoreductase [Bradyrhizobium genosp. L]QPF85441.1 FAD-binding oxidoreductase [Bradyrhizobium genosp. L]